MRLDHIIVSVYILPTKRKNEVSSDIEKNVKKKHISWPDEKHLKTYMKNLLLIMPGGHSGEEIPVPIPNTEVKLSYADDTAAKWESR